MASRGRKPPCSCSSKAGNSENADELSRRGSSPFSYDDYTQPRDDMSEVPGPLYSDEQETYGQWAEQDTEQENEAAVSTYDDEKQAGEQWEEEDAEQEITLARMRAKEKRDRESTRAIQHLVEAGADEELIEYELKKNETDPLDEVQILHDLIETGASDRAIDLQAEYVSGINIQQLEDFDIQESASSPIEDLMAYSEGECPATPSVTATNRWVNNDNLPSGDILRTYQDRPEQNIETEDDVIDIAMKVARRDFEEMTPPERNRRRQSLGLPPRPSYLRQDIEPVYPRTLIAYPVTQEGNYSFNTGGYPGARRSSCASSPRPSSRHSQALSQSTSKRYSSPAPARPDAAVNLEKMRSWNCPASQAKSSARRNEIEQKRQEAERLMSMVNEGSDGTPAKMCPGAGIPTLEYDQYQQMLQSEARDVVNALNLSIRGAWGNEPICKNKSTSHPVDNSDEIDVPVAMAAEMTLIGEAGLTMESSPNKMFAHLFPNFQEEGTMSVGPVALSPKGVVVPVTEDTNLVPGSLMEDAALMATVVKMDATRPTKSLFNDTVGATRLNTDDTFTSRLATMGENSLDATLADISVGIGRWPESQALHLTSLSMGHGLSPDGTEFVLTEDKPSHGSKVQLRGTNPPRWFPGYMSALPALHPDVVVLSEKPSEVMHNAWATLNPHTFSQEHFMVIGM